MVWGSGMSNAPTVTIETVTPTAADPRDYVVTWSVSGSGTATGFRVSSDATGNGEPVIVRPDVFSATIRVGDYGETGTITVLARHAGARDADDLLDDADVTIDTNGVTVGSEPTAPTAPTAPPQVADISRPIQIDADNAPMVLRCWIKPGTGGGTATHYQVRPFSADSLVTPNRAPASQTAAVPAAAVSAGTATSTMTAGEVLPYVDFVFAGESHNPGGGNPRRFAVTAIIAEDDGTILAESTAEDHYTNSSTALGTGGSDGVRRPSLYYDWTLGDAGGDMAGTGQIADPFRRGAGTDGTGLVKIDDDVPTVLTRYLAGPVRSLLNNWQLASSTSYTDPAGVNFDADNPYRIEDRAWNSIDATKPPADLSAAIAPASIEYVEENVWRVTFADADLAVDQVDIEAGSGVTLADRVSLSVAAKTNSVLRAAELFAASNPDFTGGTISPAEVFTDGRDVLRDAHIFHPSKWDMTSIVVKTTTAADEAAAIAAVKADGTEDAAVQLASNRRVAYIYREHTPNGVDGRVTGYYALGQGNPILKSNRLKDHYVIGVALGLSVQDDITLNTEGRILDTRATGRIEYRDCTQVWHISNDGIANTSQGGDKTASTDGVHLIRNVIIGTPYEGSQVVTSNVGAETITYDRCFVVPLDLAVYDSIPESRHVLGSPHVDSYLNVSNVKATVVKGSLANGLLRSTTEKLNPGTDNDNVADGSTFSFSWEDSAGAFRVRMGGLRYRRAFIDAGSDSVQVNAAGITAAPTLMGGVVLLSDAPIVFDPEDDGDNAQIIRLVNTTVVWRGTSNGTLFRTVAGSKIVVDGCQFINASPTGSTLSLFHTDRAVDIRNLADIDATTPSGSLRSVLAGIVINGIFRLDAAAYGVTAVASPGSLPARSSRAAIALSEVETLARALPSVDLAAIDSGEHLDGSFGGVAGAFVPAGITPLTGASVSSKLNVAVGSLAKVAV